MLYESTRGQAQAVPAARALLWGAAPDGGLYMPQRFPDLSYLLKEEYAGLDYAALAGRVFAALLPGFDEVKLNAVARSAYGPGFDDPAVAPLVRVGGDYILELSHGPTAAFKDLALQALPRLMALAREKTGAGERCLVLTATSGDTGSAAMRGFMDVPGFRVLVFYPEGGVSAVQLAQMTRMPGGNVKAVGIRGNFDEAQSGVKEAFLAADSLLPRGMRLSSANSINIGRLVPQLVYYIAAIRALQKSGALKPGQTVDFVVPSGNFGDILAGWLAGKMGLPVGRLVCASNANRVLTDFLQTGVYDRRRSLQKTISPSMDILVSSNLERLLFEASGRDGARVRLWMNELKEKGFYRVEEDAMAAIRRQFTGFSASDGEALGAIRDVWERHRYLLDPHTAAAWLGRRVLSGGDTPCVVLSTASPFKFASAVLKALGEDVPDDISLPGALSEKTGIAVPRSLRGLERLPLRHGEIINKEDMLQTVRREAASWKA